MLLRNIVLGLVLDNVLLMSWQSWIVPPEVADPGALATTGEPLLVLAPRAGPRNPTTQQSWPGEAEQPPCIRLGPFEDAAAADSVSQQLKERRLSVTLASREGRP